MQFAREAPPAHKVDYSRRFYMAIRDELNMEQAWNTRTRENARVDSTG